MVGSCVKRVDRELLGTEVRVPETTDLHRNATGDVLFMCDKSYREKHRLREKNEMLCVRGLLFKLMVHIIERTDHSVLGLIYTACYFTLIYGHYLHRIYGPLAL